MRVATYARYSDDKQNDKSIEDQLFEARKFAGARSWTIVAEYYDRAVTGSTRHLRPGFLKMVEHAREGRFDCILIEDVDRLARRLSDASGFGELMEFIGVEIWTLAAGRLDELQLAFKGTLSAQFLRDLAQKTHRGQAGRVREGRIAGGKSYGYRPTAVTSEHEIVPEEAEVVRRIFRMRMEGHSSRDIAGILNSERIPSPRGGEWNASTIHGCRKRRLGILRNEQYIGRIVWNRQKFMRNPETGHKQSRLREDSEVITKEAPHLRIVDQEVWDAVQARLMEESRKTRSAQRPSNRYMLSGLIRCGSCGRPYTALGGPDTLALDAVDVVREKIAAIGG